MAQSVRFQPGPGARRCAVELDPVFNIQLNSQEVDLSADRETAMSAHVGTGNWCGPFQWRRSPKVCAVARGVPFPCQDLAFGDTEELWSLSRTSLSGLTGQAPTIQSACDGQL